MGVLLAGLTLPNVENHSLAVLRGALDVAGVDSATASFRGWPDMETVLDQALSHSGSGRDPEAVFGVSIQNTEAALASIVLARLLRRRGFSGRIVCGGHFATLNAAEILNEVPEVDAVVRLAGEEALVGLARGAVGDDALAALPGIVFRRADGQVEFGAPARAVRPVPAASHDGRLPVHLGFPAADLVGSTGCEAHCSYCCVAATTRLAEAEAARGGANARDAGATGVVRWNPEQLAGEIADLHHTRGARVFTIMDDNLLPHAPDEAEAFLLRFKAALRANGVGRIALSLQLRADVVTPTIAAALSGLGLARAYVGIDGFSRPQLARLGRSAPAAAGPTALRLLADHGIFSVCNALLVGPTLPLESIQAELDGMRKLRGAPLHLLPIDARAGTTYHARAQRLGLLEGGMLWQRYRYADPRTEVLAEIVTGFPSRLQEHSVPLALYDLAYNLGIARRLLPQLPLARQTVAYARISDAWNADQLRILEAALAIASSRDLEAAREFVAAETANVRRHDRELLDDVHETLRSVEQAVRDAGCSGASLHLRGQLLSAVAFSMALAGCSSPPLSIRDGAVVDSGGLDAVHDAPGREVAACVDASVMEQPPRLSLECLGVCVSTTTFATARFDDSGKLIGIYDVDGGMLSPTAIACIEGSLGRYCYPSLAGTTQPIGSHCWIA